MLHTGLNALCPSCCSGMKRNLWSLMRYPCMEPKSDYADYSST